MSERVFLPTADQNYITVVREDKTIRLSPAEVNKATQLLGIALGMEAMKTLPSHITNTPFVIRFFENDQLALERTDINGSMPFKWEEADELITAILDGERIAINERTLIKGARGTGSVPISQEPFI